MFQVGIKVGNVVIEKAIVNEKGTLEITMKETVEGDAMDLFTSNSDQVVSEQSNTFMEFNQLDVVRFGNELTLAEVKKDYAAFKAKLMHILLGYKTEDKIKIDALKGTGITSKETLEKKIMDKAILDILYSNLVTGFVKELGTVDLSKKFHLKTVRQSKAKHYAKLPDSKFGYAGKNAFWQDAALPCTLEYTDYEIKKELNNPNPVQADTTASDSEVADQQAQVDDVFGA